MTRLRDANLLSEVAGIYSHRVHGELYRGDLLAGEPVLAESLALHCEELSIRGDPRLDVLGLPGIEQLQLLNIPREL